MNKLLLTLLMVSILSKAQYRISGQVIDETTQSALPYASIKLFQNQKLIGGNLSNETGKFEINTKQKGSYNLEIEFIGYAKWTGLPFDLDQKELNLGTIKLKSRTQTLGEVDIRAEKSSVELSLDKKVFNVGKDLANAGGSASEILMNVPSVSVEADGGIKLRGSENVRILVDGKPSGLVSFKGGSGLQNLPANMIDKIEVITNPSARYEAEGMAGIINIVLKKNQNQGFNGSVDLVTGLPQNQGLGLNFNYRKNKLNWFVNYGITYREQPNISFLEQEVFPEGQGAIGIENRTGPTFISVQDRNGVVTGLNNNIRGGFDYFFNEKSTLTGSYLFKRSDAHRITDFVYQDFLNSKTNKIRNTARQQDETEDEPNAEYALIYKKDFGKKGHSFTAEGRFLDNWEQSNQKFYQDATNSKGEKDIKESFLQTSINDEYEKQYLVQLDYSQPFAKNGKFELGTRTSFRNMVNDYYVAQGTNLSDQEVLPNFKNYFVYDENIIAGYGIVANKTKNLSWQAGLRTENTDVTTTLKETNKTNPRNYFSLFPSLHITNSINAENALQLSANRRIRRPVYNELSPFTTFADARNFNAGNPNLNPEFTWSYEAGYIKYLKNTTINAGLFYRDTENKIQGIRSLNNDGFATISPENLKGEKSFGSEFFMQTSHKKWYRGDATFSLFRALIDGSNIDPEYVRSTNSWFLRQSNRFSLPHKLDLQVRANYEAPQRVLQGIRKSLFYMDLSASKEIFKGKGNLNLNALDVFNSRVNRSTAEGSNFYNYGRSQFRRRQVNLTLNYRINNGKKVKSLIEE